MTITRVTIQLVLAVLLSTCISRTSWLSPVSPCIHAPGCIDSSGLVGKASTQYRGFPVAYRETTSFMPTNHHRYAIVSEEAATTNVMGTITTVLINVVFWYALLEVISCGLVPIARKKMATGEKGKG